MSSGHDRAAELKLTAAIVDCTRPCQSTFQHGEEGVHEPYPCCGAVDRVWFLEKEKSAFFKGVAPVD